MINIPYSFSGNFEYQDYATLERRFRKFEKCYVIGKDDSGNHDMYLIELGTRGKPTLMLSASMDGTEWQTTQYSLAFMEALRDDTFPDRNLRNTILDNFCIAYIPVMNPWGLDRVPDHVDGVYAQFNSRGRNNSNGINLNTDFYSFTQQESRNVRAQADKYKPFAYIDMHMFQPEFSTAYGRRSIIASGQIQGGYQTETRPITLKWKDSFENYVDEVITRWTNFLEPTSELARGYFARRSNPWTPYTLSYITELVRPAIVRGQMVRKLTNDEIFQWGTAHLYLFFKTSIEYFEVYNDISDKPSNKKQPKPPEISVVIKNNSLENESFLENAYDIGYDRPLNDLWKAYFSLPIDDPKNEYCKPLNFVEITDIDGEYIGLFRIIPSKTRKLATINEVQYECEHVLSTLLNDVLFRYHQRSNYATRDNIEYILSQQTTSHWRLGKCEITRYFHYKWENENGLLGALFSITEPFDEPYVWTWDTKSYPWTLNLEKPETIPTAEVRFGKNLSEIEREVDPSNIVNRLYPLGYGDGVNQLDIKRVNNGREFIENQSSIAEYGLQSYVWVDRRFEDDESLLASAQKFLSEWSIPKVTYRVKAVDLSSLTGLSVDKFTVGKVVRVVDPEVGTFDAMIVNERKPDIIGAPYDIEFELSNKADGVGSTLADIERRQEINEAYSQGATNILTFQYQDNADANTPARIQFFVDDDVVHINSAELTFDTENFRAYSRATAGGGAIVDSTKGGGGTTRSTSEGGATTRTSSSGGGTSRSTSSGGASTRTSSSNGTHRHRVAAFVGNAGGPPSNQSWQMFDAPRRADGTAAGVLFIAGATGDIYTDSADGAHTHSVSIPAHTHDFTVPNHTHTIDIPNHSHNVVLPDHTHEIELPNHTHQVQHEIIELNRRPSRVSIRVDGNTVPFTSTSGDRIDIVDYLDKDQDGKIRRGRHMIEITPNDLGRIDAFLVMRVFIQSSLGGVY